MRMTEEAPLTRLVRLNAMQKDSVLNWMISSKHGLTYETDLPAKKEYTPKRKYPPGYNFPIKGKHPYNRIY